MKTLLLTGKSTSRILLLVFALFVSKTSWAQPANDGCGTPVTLTPALSCNNFTATLNGATITSPAIGNLCAGVQGGDVWFQFTAQSAYPKITIINNGSSIIAGNTRIQIYSGTCAALTPLACASGLSFNTSAVYGTGLSTGTDYFIRVFTTTPAPSGANWDFDICVIDAPTNDLCADAVTLSSGLTCSTIPGTLNNSAVSNPAIATGCGTAGGDVWYKFAVQSAFPTISLSSPGSSLTGTSARIQIFSGSCGSLTSLGCISGLVLSTSTVYPTGLTVGDTCFVRVYSTTIAPSNTDSRWDYNICVQDPPVNDSCIKATTLVSDISCSSTPGTLNNSSASNPTIATTCGTSGGDVWYKFVAQSAYPKINLSNPGTSMTGANARIQLFSGDCTTLNALGCVSSQSLSVMSVYSTGLTIGDTYYVRVYHNTAAPVSTTGAFNFDICVQDAPVNDVCAGAVVLNSDITCINTPGTLYNSNVSFPAIATTCGTAGGDVWYKFAAETPYPIITLSNHGGGLTAANCRIQLFSGSCAGLTSLACVNNTVLTTSTSYTAGLTVGDTFYIRVYTNTLAPITAWTYDICVRDPLPPVNDNCSGATTLTPGTSCVNTAGTLFYATSTAGVPDDCGNASSPDVWYSFVATNSYPMITLSGVGAQLTAAGTRIQLLEGSCGSWISLGCVSGLSLNAGAYPGGSGLVIGNTYYIRVYSNAASISGTTLGFNICITNPSVAPTVDYGKSYVNITKGINGGTIEAGDVLEIRATVAVRGNSAFNVSFSGSVPANTTYIPGTLRILTNEGKIYNQWTDAADGDPANITGSVISINMGKGATNSYGGVLRQGDRPTAGGANMVMATYRVTVDAVSIGSTINVGGGIISYTNPDGSLATYNFPTVNAVVYKNYGICTNTVGSNGILAEDGGTFGYFNTKDAPASGSVPSNYTYTAFGANAPGDYYYAVSNNTSGSTAPANYSAVMMDTVSAHRVFGHWDVIGDHTNAADPLLGNAPADVVNGQSGGYMIVINASYRTDTAFLYSVSNLCPNTSYEYSAWFRNICRTCGTDSTGAGYKTAGYIPNSPGDSSGVHPNLSFNINGYDYYTTGDILYTGQWIKKGFTYRTGPSETSMTISIRNNAPGGGGNDWAIDDIGLATCSPNLDVNPSTNTINVCYADGASLSAVIRSFFDNYTYAIWEVSTDNGATFTNTGYSIMGTITPAFNGTEYEYNAPGPSFIGDSTTHGNIFRLRVATTATNLSDPNCSFLATRTVQVRVNNCMYILKTDLLNASGILQNNFSRIQWQTVNEVEKVNFEIERSADGKHFSPIGKVQGNASATGTGSYSFTDPNSLKAATYYRIKMYEGAEFKYSKIILLSPDKLFFDVKNLVNPFVNNLSFDVITPADGDIRISIYDNFGRTVKTYTERVFKGISAIKIQNLNGLSSGTYAVRVQWQNEAVVKRVIKLNN